MHVTEVIKEPVLTEKSYLGHANGVYTFLVDKRANKVQIKKTFEEIFEVKVESVRTVNYKKSGKTSHNHSGSHSHSHTKGKSNIHKKAIITLKEGQTLDVLNDL